MDFRSRALAEIRRNAHLITSRNALAGFDGFVDIIVSPVATRTGPGESFTPFSSIEEFGHRILAAAGKSTNLEFYPRMEKLGGNGTIMAGALLASGVKVSYVGALGKSTLHPVFHELSRQADVVSLCAPATTIAVEFPDGKLMLGQMKSFDEITFDHLVATLGVDRLKEKLTDADLVALCNWTMIPQMTEIFRGFTEKVLPTLPPRDRLFFFDLADPEKRSMGDLLAALQQITRFERFGRVTLGLNLKEAQQIATALGFAVPEGENESLLRRLAVDIREKLGVATVVVHPRASAACATANGSAWVPGPYTEKPLLTTGAGDHFNAGFSIGQLLGLTPEACLTVGVCTSGVYVRTAKSPSLGDLATFLDNWK